ncbi:MAG: coenzyme F420-0:L-glutamate ligase [bacterium]
MRKIGTSAFGIRAPIIKEGDSIVDIVVQSVLDSNIELKDNDVIGLTESIVARSQGNYVSTDDIAKEVCEIFKSESVGVVFPILSRNRFSIILRGIAKSNKKIYIQLSYPADEVGNHLMDIDQMDKFEINPYTDVFEEKKYREIFGNNVSHPFTGVDYVKLYKEIINNDKVEIIFSNNPTTILDYTKEVIAADIHTNKRTMRLLERAGADKVISLKNLCSSNNSNGFNPDYGLLGSNKAGEERLKLFPRDCNTIVRDIQQRIFEKTGKKVEVMVYGDGAFKDPVGKIWELADPVVSPGFTDGLMGTPNEIKIKYIADTKLSDLKGKELDDAMREQILKKDDNLVGKGDALGTTPRQLTDLLGSLCDLMSGSGDKGTPIILIQGYFDNYATN